MRLVFVHGRDQQGKNAALLKKSWNDALDLGLAAAGLAQLKDVQVASPYYGDELEKLISQLNAPFVADVATKGGASRRSRGHVPRRIAARLGQERRTER